MIFKAIIIVKYIIYLDILSLILLFSSGVQTNELKFIQLE